jgi:hypothetical protein
VDNDVKNAATNLLTANYIYDFPRPLILEAEKLMFKNSALPKK